MTTTDMPDRCEDFDTKPGVHYHAHDLPRCPKKPVVGFGNPPRWLCMKHYGERLRSAREVWERAAEAWKEATS